VIPARGFTDNKHHVGIIDIGWRHIGKVLGRVEQIGLILAFVIPGIGKQPQRRQPVGWQIGVRHYATVARQIHIGDFFLRALFAVQHTQRQPHQRHHRHQHHQRFHPVPWGFQLFDQRVAQVVFPNAQQR